MGRRPRLSTACAFALALLVPSPASRAAAGSGEMAEPPQRRVDESSAEYLSRALASLPLSEGRAVLRVSTLGGRAPVPDAVRSGVDAVLLDLVGPGGARIERASNLDAALTDARKRRLPLVFVDAKLESYALGLEISEYAFARQFWQRALEPRGRRLWSYRFSVSLDPSLRKQGARGPARAERIGRHALPDLLDAHCTIGGDGRSLVVGLLGRRKVQTLEWTDGGLVVRADRSLDELTPLSPAPLRQPLGSIEAAGDGWLVGSSDRAELVRVDQGLAPVARFPRGYPTDSERCLPYREDGLDTRSFRCAEAPFEASKASEETRVRLELRERLGAKGRPLVVRQSSRSHRVSVTLGSAATLQTSLGDDEATLLGLGPASSDGVTVLLARPLPSGHTTTVLASFDPESGKVTPSATLEVTDAKVVASCPPHVETGPVSLLFTENEVWVVR